MATMYSPLVYPQTAAGQGYTRPSIPSTFVAPAFTPPTWSPYSSDAADRTQYWEDTAGTLTLDQVLTDALGTAGAAAYKANQAIAAGLPCTSTTTPALNATYPISDAMQNNLIALDHYYGKFNSFPNKATTVQLQDITGAPHTFSYAQFEALLQTLGDYRAALLDCIAGFSTTLPDPANFGTLP